MAMSLVLFLISSTKIYCQPPWPTNPPTGLETYGPIPEPINLTYELVGTVRYRIINNTPCFIYIQSWFIVEKVTPDGVNQIYALEVKRDTLLPQSESVITNYELFDINNLPDPGSDNFYRIVAAGVYIFQGMSGFKPLFPNENSYVIYIDGVEEPCNCFVPIFNYTDNCITLTIEPCN